MLCSRGVVCSILIFENASLSCVLIELLRDVHWLWDHAGGDRLTAKSFWIGRDDTPRCSIEAFALECAFFHCPDFLGAEFWVSFLMTRA